MKRTTLKILLEEHPEWADMQIVVAPGNGYYDYAGGSASIYVDTQDDEDVEYEEWENEPVLVFAAN